MFLTLLAVILQIGSVAGHGQDEDGAVECISCSVEKQLEIAKDKLAECERRLAMSDAKRGGYLDSVCHWVAGGSGGKPALKTTVHNFLKATQLDKAVLDPESQQKEVELTIALTNQDLVSLRRFLLNDEGSEKDIQEILFSSYHLGSGNHHHFMTSRFLGLGLTGLVQSEALMIVIATIGAGLLIWLVIRGLAVWKVAVVLVVSSIFWTWVHLYKVALAKKQATLSRMGSVPKHCLVEKQGWGTALSDAFNGLVGTKDTKCEAYYEALMVDPFWEVTPLKAITETCSQFILRPLEILGSSLGIFFNEILAPIPLLWKIPVLIVAVVLILFVLLMACRYKVKSPLLFSIEPSSRSKSKRLRNASSGDEEEDGGSKKITDERRKKSNEPLPYPTGPTMIDHLVRS